MKRGQYILICLLAMLGARADIANSRSVNAPLAANVAATQSSQPGADTHWKRNRQATKAKLANLKADVVKDMRDTSAFVQEQATPSRWLIVLAGFGLVVIQLRRKHKSLPQRRIVSY